MSQFSTDFSGYTVGASILGHADWRLEPTSASNAPQASHCVIVSATSPLQGVDRYLALDGATWSSANFFFTFLPPGTTTNSDFDTVVLWRRDGNGTISAYARGRPLSTTNDFETQGAYYRVQERATSTQRLRRLIANTSATLHDISSKNHGSDTWFWSRIYVRGTAVKAATWLADPGTPDGGFSDFPGWDHEATDSNITGTGFTGFQIGRLGLVHVAYIGVGVGTSDAPAPGGAAGQDISVGSATESEAAQAVAFTTTVSIAVTEALETEDAQAIEPPVVESLYATGTGTIVDVVNEDDTTTDLHLSVDDDPAAPDDDDWVNNAVDVTTGASVFFDVTDLPVDFGNAESGTITVRTKGVDVGGTPLKLYARLYQSDETTALSDEVEVAEETTDSSFTNSSPIAFTGLNTTADKTVWDAARIRFRWGT